MVAVPAFAQVDLGLSFTGPASYTPGSSATYTLEITNSGDETETAATITTDFPADASVSWGCTASGAGTACGSPTSGNGNLNRNNDTIAPGGIVIYELNVDFDSAMTADPLEVTAEVTDSNDASASDTVSSTRDARVDLAVVFDPDPAGDSYVPGCAADSVSDACSDSTNTFTVRISNAGPSDATGADLAIDWPDQVEAASWSCTPAGACTSATGDVAIALDVAAGAAVELAAELDYASAALENLTLDATITAANDETDEDTDNNSTSAELTVDRRADIQVTKTAVDDGGAEITTVTPNGEFDYSIAITNIGPSDVGQGVDESGILLSDDFPSVLNGRASLCPENDGSQPCWFYCPDNSITDNGVNAGDDVDPDNCPVGVLSGRGDIGSIGFTLTSGATSTLIAHVSASNTASGQISNTASVNLATDDPVTELLPDQDNSDSAVVDVVIGSDFAVTKTDDATSAVPGTEHGYTITVRNNGFIGGENIRLTDTFPLYETVGDAGFESGTIRWQCRAFDGACCNHNSANCGASQPTAEVFGDLLDQGVDLPAQSRVEFTVAGLLHPRASGTLSNTAEIVMPDTIDDTNASNNTATDDDTQLIPVANLTIQKSLVDLVPTDGEDGPPFTLEYRITVGNQGPSFVAGATVDDPLDSSLLERGSASWSCEVITDPGDTACLDGPGTGALAAEVDLDPGGSVGFDLSVETTDIASGEVINTATVGFGADEVSTTLTSGLAGEADLSVTKTDNRATAVPGAPIDYVITVQNAGPDDAFGARVVDTFPPEIESLTWSCEATTPVPGDLAFRQGVGAGATGGHALTASGDGRHVYVVGTGVNSLFVFDRNNTPGLGFGEVVPLETETQSVNDPQDLGAAVSGMVKPIDVALDPDGVQLYVLSEGEDDAPPAIAVFARVTNPADPAFGRLTFIGSVTEGLPATPRRLAVTGGNLYVTGDAADDSGVIAIFGRDPATGLPQHDVDHTADVPAAPGPLVIDPSRDRLFAGSTTGQTLAAFTIQPAAGGDPAGRLSLADSLGNVADLAGIVDLTLAPDAEHLYVLAGDAARLSIVDYSAGLSRIFTYSAADMGTAGDPLAGAGAIAIAPDGEHLLGVSRDRNTLYRFRRDPPSGGLSFEEAFAHDAVSHPGLEAPADLLLSADGRHVLIAAAASTTDSRPLTVYSRQAPDPLFAFIEADRQGVGGVDGLTAPNDVAVSPDGAHVYAVSLPDDALSVFTRSPRKGLTDDTLGEHLAYRTSYFQGQNGVAGLDRARRVLVSPNGDSVFVTSEDANTLAVFDRDADTGLLSFRQVFTDGQNGVDGLLGAQGMAMDATSQHLYVAGAFDAAIAIFRRNTDGSLSYRGRVVNGTDAVAGLSGIRDLVVSGDGRQLLGVSTTDNALVVFDRNTDATSDGFGDLRFVQAQIASIGTRPMALAIPGASAQGAGEHVYVVGQNSDSVAVLRRVTDPASTAFGRVQPLTVLTNNAGGVGFLDGPRDVAVSPDGKRVYVAAEFTSAVLVFDRDLNASGPLFGFLSPVETRRNNVDGVAGLRNLRALAVSNDSANVYAAGFGDGALASFVRGTGSSCTAGGAGNIDDRVDIGAGGTLVYRASGIIRPDAVGTLSNTATVEVPEAGTDRFEDTEPDNNSATDTTELIPEGDVSVTKTSDRVSVAAGESVVYEVTVRNSGPSHLVHETAFPLTLTDLLPADAGFVPDSASWQCEAEASGALDFVDVYRAPDFAALNGIAGLALVPNDAAGSPIPLLAGASVLDDALVLLARDAVDGRLSPLEIITDGDSLGGQMVDSLAGARAVAATSDGRFLYVASRVSDSVTVFELGDAAGTLTVDLVQAIDNRIGLDQAVHLVLSPDEAHLYVAGANDDAIAVFARDTGTGELSWVESEQNGVDDPDDAGGSVSGLIDVEYLIVSPDGDHLYALSASTASIALFDRAAGSGELSWRRSYDGLDLATDLAGVSAAVFDSGGEYLYLAASLADRIVVLARDTAGGGSHGALTPASAVAEQDAGVGGLVGVRRLAMSGDDVHLYATAQRGDSVAWFVRDDSDGSLRFGGLRGNENTEIDGLGGATGLVIDGRLDQLYVAGTGQAAISQFERRSDSFCPVSGGGPLDGVAFDLAAGGEVTFTIEVEVASDFSGELVNEVEVTAARDPNPNNNTATETNTTSVVADLAITKTDGLSEFDGLDGARALAGTDEHLYVAGADDDAIGVFQRNIDTGAPDYGDATFSSVVRNGENGVLGLTEVDDLVLSGDAAHLYAVSPVDNALAEFARDPGDGSLDYLGVQQNGILGVTGLSGATAVAVSPDDAHVYTAGGFANAVSAFARETDPLAPDYGRLTFLGMNQDGVDGVGGLGVPVALALAPDGRHVYVLGAESDTLAVLARNPSIGSANYGRLSYATHYTNNTDGVAGLAGATDLAIGADGVDVYVLGAQAGTVARFQRDAQSGELSFVEFIQDGVGDTTGLTGARRLRLAPSGTDLYVAGGDGATITRYAVDGNDGSLAFAEQIANGDAAPLTGGQVFGLDGVAGLLPSADGAHLYAVARTADALTVFRRNPSLDFQDILVDGQGGVAPGDPVTYTIVAENRGPSNVTAAQVVDDFPDAFDSIDWVCTSSGGAQCQASGSGNLDVPVELPLGGRVTFQATGLINAGATGRLINTATVTGSGVVDPDVSNNSATDDDTVLSPTMDLVVEVDNGSTESTPGATVDYAVTAANPGPSYARGARLSDALPAALYDVAWNCTPQPPAGILDTDARLAQSGPLSIYRDLVLAGDGRFAYAVGAENGVAAVVVYRRDPLTGALAQRRVLRQGEAGVTGIRGAAAMVSSADGRFLYVAGAASDAVAVFSRDADSGELSFETRYQDGDPGIEGLGGVHRLLISPDGAHLYAAGAADEALAAFAIDATDGRLTQVGIVRQGVDGVDGLNGVADLAWSLDGDHLLAVATDNASLAAFARNASTGALTPAAVILDFQLADPDALADPVALEVTEFGVFVAAADRIGRFRFTVDEGIAGFEPADALTDATLDTASLVSPAALRFDPDQARLYLATAERLLLISLLGEQPQLLAEYAVDDFPVLDAVARLRISPNDRHLYTVGAAQLGIWPRERGSRCPVAGTGPLGPQTVDIAAGGGVVYRIGGRIQPNASGELNYSVTLDNPLPEQELNPADNTDSDVDQLVPRPDLALTKTRNTDPVVAGESIDYTLAASNAGLSDALGATLSDQPPLFDADPAGLTPGSGSWSCRANPPLDDPAVVTDGAGLDALFVGAGGGVYATRAADDALLVFAADLSLTATIRSGDSLPGGVVSGLGGASAVAVSTDERHVYVTGRDDHSLVVLTRAAAGEPWQFVQVLTSGTGGVAGLQGPGAVLLSPDERFVYVAAAGSDSIAVFARDADDGRLSFVERVRDGFGTIVPESNVIRGVRALHMDADGSHLYAVATNSRAISHFAVNATSGAMDFRNVWRQGDAGIAGLDQVRDLAAAPGDGSLYALGADGIARFDRQAEGTLAYVSTLTDIPDFADPRALVVDRSGSRAYLLDTAAIHVFARDWQTGELEHRFREPVAAAATLAQDAEAGRLLVAATDALRAYPEQALSRCLTETADSDSVDAALDLGVAGWAEFSYQAEVHPRARGDLVNRADIAVSQGEDPDPADNTAEDTATIEVVSELTIAKTGPAEAVAGEGIAYTITVGNSGPSAALGIEIADTLPDGLVDASWTCQADNDSSCTAGGSGDVDLTADLDPGDELVIDLTATIASSVLGTLGNTAGVTPEPGASDPTPDDHDATLDTRVRAVSDLALGLSGPPAFDPGGGAQLPYRVTVHNAGPSDARDVVIELTFTPSVDPVSVGPCVVVGDGLECALGTLAAGANLSFDLAVDDLPPAPAELQIAGQVSTSSDDPVADNDTASLTTQLIAGGDIRVTVDNGQDQVSPGQTPRYVISVTNIGTLPVGDIDFAAPLAAQLLDACWICLPDAGAGCTASGSGGIADQLTLDGGQGVVYLLEATVDPALDPNDPITVGQTAGATVSSGDINPTNNSAIDEDPLVPSAVILMDDFEDSQCSIGGN